MARPELDLSLYLVTQSESIAPNHTWESNLREAIEGGVTIIQIREKDSSTLDFLERARIAKTLCDSHTPPIPLIINDRLDIAQAISSSGVHLGQDDLSCTTARKILGPDVIIGVSCNRPEEAVKAVEDGADYIGIGPVYETKSKKDPKESLGPRGARLILEALDRKSKEVGREVKVVVIGGINSSNVLRVLHGVVTSTSPTPRMTDGIAVISAIVSSTTPKESASYLSRSVASFRRSFGRTSNPLLLESVGSKGGEEGLKKVLGEMFDKVRSDGGLVQQVTNTVVQNDSANITLALSSSPIMSSSAEEASDLSAVLGALVINLGTLTEEQVEGMHATGKAANLNRKPVIFDPVAVGATQLRKKATNRLLNRVQMSIIKGNAGEIGALTGENEVKSRGVDSVGPGFKDPGRIALDLAKKERSVIVLTGAVDWVSDGESVYKIENGHKYLGDITGSGCMTGSCIGCFSAAASSIATAELGDGDDGEASSIVRGDMLAAAIGGILAINVAAEIAAKRSDVKGPNTFRSALIDEVYNLTKEDFLGKAKVTKVL